MNAYAACQIKFSGISHLLFMAFFLYIPLFKISLSIQIQIINVLKY